MNIQTVTTRWLLKGWLVTWAVWTGACSPFEVRSASVPLFETEPSRSQVGALRYLAGFELTSRHKGFGGFSGCTVVDGNRLVAVSDRGHWWSTELLFADDGALLGLAEGRMGRLHDFDGQAVKGRARRDAEELIPWEDGSFLVAFEGDHRVALYPPGVGESMALASVPSLFPVPFEIPEGGENAGLEAGARLADGRLLLLTESQRHDDGTIRGWVGEFANVSGEARWASLGLVSTDAFRPTALAALPSGDALLVERSYSPEDGTRVRFSILRASRLAANVRLSPEELGRLEPPATVDNFEALAVWAESEERILVYLLSDDNFSDSQRTLLLQFELPQLELTPSDLLAEGAP